METFDLDVNAPWNNEDENECGFCGNPCSGSYCDNSCKKADNDDTKYE